MPCRATWGSTRVGQKTEGVKGEHKQEPLEWFLQELRR